MQAAIEKLKPVAGSATYAADAQLYDQVKARAAQMMRRRDDSPAAYAMTEPSVAEAYDAAAKDPALLPAAIGKSLAVTQQAVIDQFRRQIEAEPEWHQGVMSMSGWTQEFFGAPGSFRRPTAC